jgi:two-component system sensor histidine kinase HydH
LPELPVEVFIDPEQIHQVVVNLLLNSLDALPRGGAIWVEGGSPGNGLLVDDGQVQVRVRDSGSGIAPRILKRLFEPFVSTKETGVGLGLSISKRLIEDHGGTIRGANVVEGGAEFVFTLPMTARELEPSHADALGRGR